MKRIFFSYLVFLLAVPAMGQVKVLINRTADANKVTIGYLCTAGEKVRAFAIDVSVNRRAYVVGSATRLDPNYYVTPSNIQFAVTGSGVTYISGLGSPVVSKSVYPNDANGFTIEMASLYAAGDPNHPNPPGPSGTLIQFGLDCSKLTGNFGTIDVSISANAKRGGIVLEDGNSVPVIFSPSTYVPPKLSFCRCSTFPCWCCPGQPSGDADGNGSVSSLDYLALKKAYGTTYDGSPSGKLQGQYNCCCDFNHDGSVNSLDYLIFKMNYGRTGMGACADTTCPRGY